MPSFNDSQGRPWAIMFDGPLLQDVLTETRIDLGDVLGASGWLAIAGNVASLSAVLAVLCRDEIRARNLDARAFQKALRGDVFADAIEALELEGASFFPRNAWSAIQLALRTRENGATEAAKMAPLMAALAPLPPEMRAGVIQEMTQIVSGSIRSGLHEKASIISPDGPASPAASAGGQGATLPSAV